MVPGSPLLVFRAHRPGEIERQLKRVADPAATIVPDGEGVGAQHRRRNAAEGAGPGRHDRLEVFKADAEEGPAAGFARPPAGQYASLVGKLVQLQLEDSGAGCALLHRDRGRKEGSGQLGGRLGLRLRARREGVEGARDVTCCQSATSSSSAQPEALRDAAAIPWSVALSPRPLWSWLRSERSFPARLSAGGVPEKPGSSGAFLPLRLLVSSVPTAAVGNPGEGGWAVAGPGTCPRANPGAASGLVPGTLR